MQVFIKRQNHVDTLILAWMPMFHALLLNNLACNKSQKFKIKKILAIHKLIKAVSVCCLMDTHCVTSWLPSCWAHCKKQQKHTSVSRHYCTVELKEVYYRCISMHTGWEKNNVNTRKCAHKWTLKKKKKSSLFCTFAVLISVLEGLHQPQSLIHRSPHRKIVHRDLPQDAFVIDDEKSPDRNSQKAFSTLSDPL